MKLERLTEIKPKQGDSSKTQTDPDNALHFAHDTPGTEFQSTTNFSLTPAISSCCGFFISAPEPSVGLGNQNHHYNQKNLHFELSVGFSVTSDQNLTVWFKVTLSAAEVDLVEEF